MGRFISFTSHSAMNCSPTKATFSQLQPLLKWTQAFENLINSSSTFVTSDVLVWAVYTANFSNVYTAVTDTVPKRSAGNSNGTHVLSFRYSVGNYNRKEAECKTANLL